MRGPGSGRAVRGVTFIDLLCVMAAIAILWAVVLPSYRQAVLTVRRSDAVAALLELQLAQERHRIQAGRYGSLAELRLSERSRAGHYRLALRSLDREGFEARALADGAQAEDASCRQLALRVVGSRVEQRSGGDDAIGNADPVNRRCWRR